MLSTIRFELHRIFSLRTIILFFIQIAASLFFAWEYKRAFPIESGFCTFLRTFTIFGTYIMILMGFLTFPDASTNRLFFNDREKLTKTTDSYTGFNIFSRLRGIMGWGCHPLINKKSFFIKTIVSRLLLLDFYFLAFFVVTYGGAGIFGIAFTYEERLVLFDFVVFVIVLLNFFYAAGLVLYIINKYKGIPLRKKKIEKIEVIIPDQLKRNNILFILMNKYKQGKIIQGLLQGNRHVLDRDSHLIMPGEVRASVFIDYSCREKKIDKDKVLSNLEILNIPESRLKKKISGFSRDEKKMLICAIVFADGRDIVLYDFLKGLSESFEKLFLELLSREDYFVRRVIYMSSDMYSTYASLDKRELDIDNYILFQFEPKELSLR